MATYSTQVVDNLGTAITLGAVTAADRFVPGQGVFLWVKNGSGSSINVTLVTPGTVDGLAIADRVIAVPAGADRLISLPDYLYRSSDGLGDVQFSATTTVTAGVVRI